MGHSLNFKGWPKPYVHTIYDRISGDSPVKNAVYTSYINIIIWFWPTLFIQHK